MKGHSRKSTAMFSVLMSWLTVQVGFGIIVLFLLSFNRAVLAMLVFGSLGGLISLVMLKTGEEDFRKEH